VDSICIVICFFSAITSILAKIGIDSNLATAIRTVVVLIMAWVTVKTIIGGIFITIGTFVMILGTWK